MCVGGEQGEEWTPGARVAATLYGQGTRIDNETTLRISGASGSQDEGQEAQEQSKEA